MKVTIEDRNSSRKTKLDIAKHPRNKSFSLLEEDTRGKLLEFHVTRGQMGVSVDRNKVKVYDISSATEIGGAAMIAEKDDVQDSGRGRNWEIDETQMAIANPKTDSTIKLDRKLPALYTPKQKIWEILGQPEMTFSVAWGLEKKRHSMLMGPTGTGKTQTYLWFAQQLGYNCVICPIARGTEASHLVGDYLPVGQALFEWTDGPVTLAVRLSQHHPTILVFDEINRIGNIAEFSRVYSVLDDTRMLELSEKKDKEGIVERLEVGDLYIGATANPSDDEAADYIGVQDLDPALASRFSIYPTVDYPAASIETDALELRTGLDRRVLERMVTVAGKIRKQPDVRFPISFRELESWAMAYPQFGWGGSARIAVVNKAPRMFQKSISDIIKLVA